MYRTEVLRARGGWSGWDIVSAHLPESEMADLIVEATAVTAEAMPLDRDLAFVALPPDQLPATASAAEFVQAAITLERVAPEQAAQAYRTALQRWPQNLEARLALGNRDYQRRDVQAAQTHYEQATRDHPEAADAWNNLAQVLYETHQWEAASQAIAQAVAIGGPRLERYKTTQRAITQQREP